MDMLDDRVRDREATAKDVEEVLRELGDPAVLADKYRGYQRYLIGPEIFPNYFNILKIVFFAIGIAFLVVFSIQTVLNPPQVFNHFLSSLGSFIMSCFQAFTWVTVIFGVIEYTGIQKDKIAKMDTGPWSTADLPFLPDDESKIRRADPIASIIFTVLFLVLLTFSSNLFGVWVSPGSGSSAVIPFFNEDVFRSFLPFIWAMGAVSILNEVIKLVARKWSFLLIALDTLTNILGFLLALYMFSNLAIWNPNFIQQMGQIGLAPAGSELYEIVNTVWTQVTRGIIYLIGVVFAGEMISTVIKMFRMKNLLWKGYSARTTSI